MASHVVADVEFEAVQVMGAETTCLCWRGNQGVYPCGAVRSSAGAVNKELIALYWDIGKTIEAKQLNESWGASVLRRLAADLRAEFPESRGSPPQNLWRMRQFYKTYGDDAKLSPLVREISWTKNVVILTRCKDPHEREFYLRMTGKFGWSENVLIHHIENQSYQKTLLNQTNFDAAVTADICA